jgi:peptidoglycan/LPS O-acetylase OafA/YrhL
MPGFTYRPALDGLRAVAVFSVIVYHVNEPWLPGGFLGVDLFFVLSGFLITSLLLVEHEGTNRINLSRFWSRRARRLLPAILILLIVVAIVEHQVVAEATVRAGRRGELLATLFYAANWFFIATGRSYFADYGGASPVRHTWSLAIEEQFYLLFPLIMSFGLRLKRRWLLAAVLATLGVSGWLMAALFTPSNPSRSYFGTDARIHQLLAGAVLAILLASRYQPAIVAWTRRMVFPASLALVAAFLLMRDDGSFYYHGGAVGIGLVTAVLIAGLEHPAGLRDVLSIRPMVAVGKISYGMYLWHFPLIVWLLRFSAFSPGVLLAVTLVLTLIAATVSYTLVERPIRVNRKLFRFDLTPRRLAYVVPVASLVTAGILVVALPDALPEWAREGDVAAAQPSRVVPSPGTTVDLAESPVSGITAIAVVGDSFMVSAYPGFRTAAAEEGWTLTEAAFAACPIGEEPLANLDGEPHYKADTCHELVSTAYAVIAADPPDVIVWHDLQSVLPRYADDGSVLVPGTTDWQHDLLAEWRRVLNVFLGYGSRVVIIDPPFRSQDAACSGLPNEARCLDIVAQDEIIQTATAAFRQQVGDETGVFFVDVNDLLCPQGIPCPATIDGLVVREGGNDQTHLTEEGAVWFVREFASRVGELVG